MGDCVFCQIVAGEAPATIVRRWADAIAIVPLDPVVVGHRLVIPRRHVDDAACDLTLTGAMAAHAADLALDLESCNLITSVGAPATQTIRHLHWHVVPRVAGDGLALPWTGQVTTDGR